MPEHVDSVMQFSTAHMTREDRDTIIDGDGYPEQYMEGQSRYGFWFWTGCGALEGGSEHIYLHHEQYSRLREAGASEDLINALSKARQLGCEYAKFSSEGPVHKDLPTNDW